MTCRFKFVDRGFKEALLLVPGWAADYRIFDSLGLDFNYLLPTAFSPAGFNGALLEKLKKDGIGKVDILGWSMGGFLAADFASNYPGLVRRLTLVGARRRYDKEALGKIRGYIAVNKNGYLYKFYHECFSTEERPGLSVFKRGLMKNYLKELADEELLGGLDYLGEAELKAETLKGVRIKFIHGDSDRIAPIDEAFKLKNDLGEPEFVVIKGAGHIPFLRNDFGKAFYGQ